MLGCVSAGEMKFQLHFIRGIQENDSINIWGVSNPVDL